MMNVFDIVGPVMIGPSSSHTAGAVRIGRVARALLGCEPVSAQILLHGSFAKTYKGHGTDKALIAGIMGMATDDERIRFSPRLAEEAGLSVSILPTEIDGAHPNTALITLADATGRTVSVQGASVGGGNILVTRVNGMEVHISGQYNTLIVLHQDTPGTIAAVTELLAEGQVEHLQLPPFPPEKGRRGSDDHRDGRRLRPGAEQAHRDAAQHSQLHHAAAQLRPEKRGTS